MNKSLPCPFCGSSKISRRRRVVDYKGAAMQLFCLDCDAQGPIGTADTVEEAHEKAETAWNTRTTTKASDEATESRKEE